LALTSIQIDLSFGYTELENIGQWSGSVKGKERLLNNQKYLNLPVDITCSFTGRLRQGIPYANFLSGGQNFLNNQDNIYSEALGGDLPNQMLSNREIMLVAKSKDLNSGSETERFFVWDLGKRNHLVDISYSGGDTSGSHAEATLRYKNNFNDAVLTKSNTVHDIAIPTEIY
jgi:hypothetical protein